MSMFFNKWKKQLLTFLFEPNVIVVETPDRALFSRRFSQVGMSLLGICVLLNLDQISLNTALFLCIIFVHICNKKEQK